MRRYLRNVLFLCLLAVLTFGGRNVTCNAAESTAQSYARKYMRGLQTANAGQEFDVYGKLVYEVLSDGNIRIISCDENAQGTIEVPDSIKRCYLFCMYKAYAPNTSGKCNEHR